MNVNVEIYLPILLNEVCRAFSSFAYVFQYLCNVTIILGFLITHYQCQEFSVVFICYLFFFEHLWVICYYNYILFIILIL